VSPSPPFQYLDLAQDYEISTSPDFAGWLAGQNTSLVFTNTLEHKLFLIGVKPDGHLSVQSPTFDRCMGLFTSNPQTIYMATRYQIWRLENALPPGQTADDYDHLYLPRVAHTVGLVNLHDIAVEASGRVLFVNTRFGCLATLSDQQSFVPLWMPTFLSSFSAEDCCHLNGLALRDGRAAYVTCAAATATPDAWREHRADGGVVVDVTSNAVVAAGLSLPHSPRWYQERLWLTNSGTGEFGTIDLNAGRFIPLTFAPGFLRGLCFAGDYAVMGASKDRRGALFAGLPLERRLQRDGLEPWRGLYVVDLRSGEIVHWLRLEGVSGEIYDVVALPGVKRPTAIDFETDQVQQKITIGPVPNHGEG
jgi:uncharacterized protein (TIGR03032 family)